MYVKIILISLYQLELDMFLCPKTLKYISKYCSIFKHEIIEHIFACYDCQIHDPHTNY